MQCLDYRDKKIELYRMYVWFAIPDSGRTRNIAHSRTNVDAFDATQRSNHSRADLTGGTGHEDVLHYAVIVGFVMAGSG